MPLWGYILVGGVLVVATAIVTWLIARRPIGSLELDRKVADSAKRAAMEQLAIEKTKRSELERTAKVLRARLARNQRWFESMKGKIDADLEKEYGDMARDDDALFDKLAELLG